MIKVSLVLLAGLAATAVLRRRSAAVRHWVLAATIACAAATPALELVVPSWHLPLDPRLFGRSVEPLTLDSAADAGRLGRPSRRRQRRRPAALIRRPRHGCLAGHGSPARPSS